MSSARLLGDLAAARIGPDHRREALGLGLIDDVAQLLHHRVAGVGARIDGEADADAAEPERVLDGGGHRLVGCGGAQRVGAVHLEDGRQLAGVGVGALLEQAERRRVARQAGVDRQLIEIVGIVGRRVGREAARGAVLVALVDRQDHQLAGAGEPAVHQQPREIALHAGALALVPGQDLFDLRRELHGSPPLLAMSLEYPGAAGEGNGSPVEAGRQGWFGNAARRAQGPAGAGSWRSSAPACCRHVAEPAAVRGAR